jgi:hypothetical protein
MLANESNTLPSPSVKSHIHTQVKLIQPRGQGQGAFIEFLKVSSRGLHSATCNSLHRNYDGIIGVYDVTDSSSLGKLYDIMDPFLDGKTPIWIVGMKSDLETSRFFASAPRDHAIFRRVQDTGGNCLKASNVDPAEQGMWNLFYEQITQRRPSISSRDSHIQIY